MTPEELLAIVRAFAQRDILAAQLRAERALAAGLRARVVELEAAQESGKPDEGTIEA